MKVITLKPWNDLKEDIVRTPSENSEFECTEARFKEINEILGNGFVEKVEEKVEEKEVKKPKK